MRNLIFKYRDWLATFLIAVAISVVMSPPQVREISDSRLQKLIESREVADIAIIKNKVGNQTEYLAEITLKPAALKKYERLRASIYFSMEGPQFVSLIGDSEAEVDLWKKEMMNLILS